MTAARQRPAPEPEPKGRPPVSEEWLRRTLADWPPLTEWQRERLRVLLDLSNEADHDAA
jgi:hypothetical protein